MGGQEGVRVCMREAPGALRHTPIMHHQLVMGADVCNFKWRPGPAPNGKVKKIIRIKRGGGDRFAAKCEAQYKSDK